MEEPHVTPYRPPEQARPSLVQNAMHEARGAIAAKLASAIASCDQLEKDKKHDRFGYRYSSADEVMRVARKALAGAGLSLIPELVADDMVQVGETNRGAPIFRYEARYLMHLIDGEGNCLSVPARGETEDSNAAGFVKCQTEALKSTCISLLMLSAASDEDPAPQSQQSQQSQHGPRPQEPPPEQERRSQAEVRADKMRQYRQTIRDELGQVQDTDQWAGAIEELRTGFVPEAPEWAREALEEQLDRAEAFGDETRELLTQMAEEVLAPTRHTALQDVTAAWEQRIEEEVAVEPWRSQALTMLDNASKAAHKQISAAIEAEQSAAEEAEEEGA